MTTDEQHALSQKYIGETICLIPLASGNIALFTVKGHQRELQEIGPSVEALLAPIIKRYPDRLETNRRVAEKVMRKNTNTNELQELASALKLEL